MRVVKQNVMVGFMSPNRMSEMNNYLWNTLQMKLSKPLMK